MVIAASQAIQAIQANLSKVIVAIQDSLVGLDKMDCLDLAVTQVKMGFQDLAASLGTLEKVELLAIAVLMDSLAFQELAAGLEYQDFLVKMAQAVILATQESAQAVLVAILVKMVNQAILDFQVKTELVVTQATAAPASAATAAPA